MLDAIKLMKIHKALSFLLFLFLTTSPACKDKPSKTSSETHNSTILQKEQSDSNQVIDSKKDLRDLAIDSSKLADCIKGDFNEKQLTPQETLELKSLFPFVIPGYTIMGCAKGDLNKDSLHDYILIHLKQPPKGKYFWEMEPENSPVTILLGQKSNSWKEVIRNDSLLDPESFYNNRVLTNVIIDTPGTITISYSYDAGGLEETEQIFEYDKKKNDWFLRVIRSNRHSNTLTAGEVMTSRRYIKSENQKIRKKYPNDSVWIEDLENGYAMYFRIIERTQKDFGEISISKFKFNQNWEEEE